MTSANPGGREPVEALDDGCAEAMATSVASADTPKAMRRMSMVTGRNPRRDGFSARAWRRPDACAALGDAPLPARSPGNSIPGTCGCDYCGGEAGIRILRARFSKLVMARNFWL